MEELGVSPKQKVRARQTFMKLAQYAGFIDASTGRFVKPGIIATPRDEPPTPPKEPGHGSGGDGGDEDLHPLIKGLVATLPKKTDKWPLESRVHWFQIAASTLSLLYGADPAGDVVISTKPKSGADQRS